LLPKWYKCGCGPAARYDTRYLALPSFAAYDSNSQEALGLTGVLGKLQHQSYGELLLGIAGLGFLAFGGFEITKAKARRVRPRN
jgi:hypothetical protein